MKEQKHFMTEAEKQYYEQLQEAIELLKMFNSLSEATYGKEEFKEWLESIEYQKFLNKLK